MSGFPHGAILPPWLAEPHRLHSLGDIMRQFKPEFQSSLAEILQIWRLKVSPDSTPISESTKESACRVMATWADQATQLGFDCAFASAARTLRLLENEEVTTGDFVLALNEFAGRFKDEQAAAVFLALSLAEAKLYDDPQRGWETVIKRYRRTTRDIEEASKCLALNRGTAAVFHLTRVMELGLKSAAVVIGITYSPSWESYLKQFSIQLGLPWDRKSLLFRKNELYISEAFSLFTAAKHAWRNPTIHGRRDYTPEEAEEVYVSVRNLMKHLASKATRRRV